MTTPSGETTTIERDGHGNPTKISRAAPGSTTQETTYKYDSHGDVESMTNPLGRTWKYEYDSYGDKTAEIDPEGDKHTWSYDKDSQEISSVSPRGNVEGAEASKYTTTIERDAQGRPVAMVEPESASSGSKPSDKTPSSISGDVQEGQTLTANTGIWAGTAPLSYSYQWQHCDSSGGSCSDISGATSSTYVPVYNYVGDTLRVMVTATNSGGAASSTSEATKLVSPLAKYPSIFSACGYGEGGRLVRPIGEAFDAHGDIWVADNGDGRIEKFSSSGSWLATYGKEGSGDGEYDEPVMLAINQSTGDVYVADAGNGRIQELNEKGEWIRSWEGGESKFDGPVGVTVDPKGDVWVANYGDDHIEEFDGEGKFIKEFGTKGSGDGEFSGAFDLVFADGDLYVTDLWNSRVQEFNEKGEYVSQFGRSGSGNGEFELPGGIAAGPEGNLYVADMDNNRVQEFTSAGVFVAAYGTSGTGSGQLYSPESVAVSSSGEIYIADSQNSRIEKWGPAPAAPTYSSAFGTCGSGDGQFVHPIGEAFDAHGDVWVADNGDGQIEKFTGSGSWLATYGKEGSGDGEYDDPVTLAINQSTGDVYVADEGNDRIQELNEKGEWIRSWEGGESKFAEPDGVAVDPEGDVWVANWWNDHIEEFDGEGKFIREFGKAGSGNSEFWGAADVVFADGDLYVTDYGNSRVEEFNEKGEYVSQFGRFGSGNGELEFPGGIATGPEGNLYVADIGNSRVQEFTPAGVFVAAYGTSGTGPGQLESPEDVAVSSSGEIYIVDSGNRRIEPWVPASEPSVTTPPTISGELISGQTLRASPGNWSAVPSPTYAYQWQHCKPSGDGCSNISGATSSTYSLSSSDTGYTLRVVVTATNAGGSSTSTSNATKVLVHEHTTEYAYDANGNLVSATDPEGNTTTYTYDADNEPIKVEQPGGMTTETKYDANGQVTSQTNGDKQTTKYARNELEGIVEITDPLGHKATKEYNPDGDVTKLTDPEGRTTTYTYNADNRVTEIKYSDGKTPTVKYEYNEDGDLTKMTDGTGTTTDSYDQLDRLVETENGNKEKIKYAYNLANEPIKITYPNGKNVERGYDETGRLHSVTDWLGHTTTFSYDPDSNLAATVFPSETGEEDKYTYNDADLMSEARMAKGSETLASLAYTRGSDGQVEKETAKGLPGEETTEDDYDEDNRLTKSGTTSYAYDAVGDPTTIGSSNNTYNEDDELEESSTATYAYNKIGERTKQTPTVGPATTYGYDQAGNLISIERPKEGETPKIEDSYAYNGEGLRASQTISGATNYLAWDTVESLPVILSDGTNSYIYGPDDLPIEQINSAEKVLYLHHDQAGSTRLITGSTGTVEGKCTYSAYGTPTCEGTATTPLGYDGQYTSTDTGLIYLRNRVYDPSTAQFLTVDPLEMVTRAPYTYGEDNPLNRDDATGLSSWNPFSESFWTEGNFISESPLNPIPYYEAEIESYENGCGYFASVAHGLEGAIAGTALFAGGEGADEADITVSDVLEGKLGSITRAPLPPGSPAWADIQDMSIADVRAAAKANEPGFKTILKLLTDNRFNKP